MNELYFVTFVHVLSHGCFFLVIVMTTTNSTTQCLDYMLPLHELTLLYVDTKKKEIGLACVLNVV